MLQETLAQRWKMSAPEVTAAAIQLKLGPAGEAVRQVFVEADEIQYGVREPGDLDFARWLQIVHQQITGTEPA